MCTGVSLTITLLIEFSTLASQISLIMPNCGGSVYVLQIRLRMTDSITLTGRDPDRWGRNLETRQTFEPANLHLHTVTVREEPTLINIHERLPFPSFWKFQRNFNRNHANLVLTAIIFQVIRSLTWPCAGSLHELWWRCYEVADLSLEPRHMDSTEYT